MRLLIIIVSVAVFGLAPVALAQSAEITNCPGGYSFGHCGAAYIDFDATGEGDIFFELVSGPGMIDQVNGLWFWSGEGIPQSGEVTLEVRPIDDNGPGTICTVAVTVTNQAPTIECSGEPLTIWMVETSSQTVTVGDPDGCDPLTILVSAGANYDLEDVEIFGNEIRFTPKVTATGLVVMPVTVFDGELTQECELYWNILSSARPPSVSIEAQPDQFQGQYATVDVVLHSVLRNEGIAGFEFLFAYDASALSSPSAIEGELYSECGWEYFTYRNVSACQSGCPSGLFRVIGVANLNNGPSTPGCDVPDAGYVQKDQLPITMFSLKYLVTNDRTFECQFVPIKFFWLACEDNVISNYDGSELHLAEKVFDFVAPDNLFTAGEITGDGTQVFPTYYGQPDSCVFEDYADDKTATRRIWFQNGGVGIICADAIDARGDINQNNIAYEIGDAVMLTNYFHIGLAAFGNHVEGSIAASDSNADGLPLTIGDLVHLIRVVTGDLSPFLR